MIPSSLDVCHDEARFCVARHGCMVVVVWGREVEGVDLERLAEVQRQVIAVHGHCAVLTIIRAGLTMTVKDEVRKGGEDNLREFAGQTLGSAMVVEAGGLRATFFRSVITGIHLITRSRVPQKVFDTIDDAVNWVLSQPGVDPTTADASAQILVGARAVAEQYGEPG